jgi:hypothetical protein
MGIEPTSPAWKAGTLPLSYSRERCAAPTISKALEKTQGRATRRAGVYAVYASRERWFRKIRLTVTAVPALCR